MEQKSVGVSENAGIDSLLLGIYANEYGDIIQDFINLPFGLLS